MGYGGRPTDLWSLPPSPLRILTLRLSPEQSKPVPILTRVLYCPEIMAFEVSSFLKQKREAAGGVREEAFSSLAITAQASLGARPAANCLRLL